MFDEPKKQNGEEKQEEATPELHPDPGQESYEDIRIGEGKSKGEKSEL